MSYVGRPSYKVPDEHTALHKIESYSSLISAGDLVLYRVRGLVVNVNSAPFSSRNTALAHSARHDLAALLVNPARFLRG